MARQGRAVADGQQAEAVVETGDDLLRRQRALAGSGEFDRQREPVKPTTDLDDGGAVIVAEREGRVHRACPLHEELHRLRGLRRVAARGRERQLGHEPRGLSGDAQRLATGGHHPQAGARAQQCIGQGGAGVHQVFAVVEHQQEVPVPDDVRQAVRRRAVSLFANAECRQDGVGQQRGVAEGRQLHPGALDTRRRNFA